MRSGYDQFFKNARTAALRSPTFRPETVIKESEAKSKKAPRQMSPAARRRTRARFPMISFIISAVGFCVAYLGYENYERISQIVSRLEVSFFSSAKASDEVKKSEEPKEIKADQFSKPVVAEPTGEELNHLSKLQERKKELDAREEELNRMEAEMAKQKEELKEKIADLERMRNSISVILEEKVKADDQKVETLVQFYSNMKPPQAAKVFESIDEDLVVQILSRMKKKSAAEILNLMKPEKAQMFTEKYAGYKRGVAAESEEARAASSADSATKPAMSDSKP
jgi:flagellar motility protein MotE (MotC chaperone)